MTESRPESTDALANGAGRHAAVLRLHGDVDLFTEDDFRAEAERLVDDPQVERLIVDLGDVALMDSSGLSLLVDLLRLCRDRELPMALRAVPDRVLQLLDLTGLDRIIIVE